MVKHLTRHASRSFAHSFVAIDVSPKLFEHEVMAEEKVSHDISPDEKVAEDAQKQEHQFAEQTERRKSVALNIVENPLRVS